MLERLVDAHPRAIKPCIHVGADHTKPGPQPVCPPLQHHGLAVRDSAGLRVSANRLIDNGNAGISVTHQPDYGVIDIASNELDGNRVGIKGSTTARLQFAMNDFRGQAPRLLDGELVQFTDRFFNLSATDSTPTIIDGLQLKAGAKLTPTGALRPITEADKEQLKAHDLDADAGWMIECDGLPVAAGDTLYHYNPPYGDIYMAVYEPYRRRGFGSYLVQELKRLAYEKGKKPAARCNVSNAASRRTLQKAGMLPCGQILLGDVVK